MRVTPEQLEAMRQRIARLDTEPIRQAYRDGMFPRAGLVKDLDKRYRWDLFYASKASEVTRDSDLTMAHIDTALRKIVAPL